MRRFSRLQAFHLPAASYLLVPVSGSSVSDAQVSRALTIALRTATALLGSRENASDVAQSVVVRVIERRTQLRDPDRFDAWVHRIAVREALAWKRSMRRRGAREASWEEHGDGSSGLSNGFEHEVLGRLSADRMMAALPDRERVAMTLRYVHGLPDSQIASIMRCRRGTVNSLLSRARARLRRMDEIHTTAGVEKVKEQL